MTDPLDIYRSAKLLIDQHGEGVSIQAAMKADAMLDNDDLDGATVWRCIVVTRNEILCCGGIPMVCGKAANRRRSATVCKQQNLLA